MLRFAPWKTTLVLLTVLWGVLFAVPNLISEDGLSDWPGFLPTKKINLGLDLRGGSHILLEVIADQVVSERLQSLIDEVRQELRGERNGPERIRVSGLALSGDTISMRIVDPEQMDEAVRRLRTLAQPIGGFGGPANLQVSRNGADGVTVTLTQEAQADMRQTAVNQSIEVVRRRIDALGTREPSIQRQGAERIVVQVPGEDDPTRIIEILNATARLSFHMVDDSIPLQDALNGRVPPGSKLLPGESAQEPFVLIRERAEITGDMLTDATSGASQDTIGFEVGFRMNTQGARRFGDITRENVGRRFAIVLDERVISAPVIQTPITGGSGRITGNFSAEEANDLAILLRAGALPAELTPLEQRTVGPAQGAKSIRAGAQALVIGFVAVIVFMVLVYGLFGVFANLALIANVFLIAGALSALQATGWTAETFQRPHVHSNCWRPLHRPLGRTCERAW